ncbi:hypothetical protein BROUX41_002802 [Berkeleyomyces rouxiae]|uniref:uncharacterized protein n=1 Tax=Berkeleyomyces rouxiae TaxID=2035830 RepID=UPI003B810C01
MTTINSRQVCDAVMSQDKGASLFAFASFMFNAMFSPASHTPSSTPPSPFWLSPASAFGSVSSYLSIFDISVNRLWFPTFPTLVLGLIAVYMASNALSRRALNHGTRSSFDWSRELVLITGGAGGIGGRTAQKLAQQGTQVVVIDVMPLSYKKPSNLHYYKCDVGSYEKLQETAAKITRDLGNPTVIIANAAVCRGKTLLKASKKDIELTFGVNTLGLLWTIKSFLPHLVAHNHGHILIMGSQTGYHTSVGGADYSATKAAAVSIYEGVHTELKHSYNAPAVRLSLIKPSHVQTNMFTGIKKVPGMASVTADYVADEIVSVLHRGDSQNKFVPASISFTPWLRVFPEWLRIALQDMTSSAFENLKPHDPMGKAS